MWCLIYNNKKSSIPLDENFSQEKATEMAESLIKTEKIKGVVRLIKDGETVTFFV